ncbi:MAG: hypothetical protein ABSA75_04960 [Candidatus Bathyarchaeia archaeon]
MKFKTEVCLLLLAITLFTVSAFFYSFQTGSATLNINLASYPYRGYALAFVGFGSVLMVTASVSYSKRAKTSLIDVFDFSAEDKSN